MTSLPVARCRRCGDAVQAPSVPGMRRGCLCGAVMLTRDGEIVLVDGIPGVASYEWIEEAPTINAEGD